MAEIIVPELAESITEGTIAQWLKKPGEAIAKGEYIAELETDKVNIEIISEHDGVVGSLLKEEGDTVQVGEAIAVITEGGAAPAP
ncbi:MAG: biotin/lipoyl-containing protein, partial [Bacillus sp. (in: firmicutes)]